MCWIGLSTVSYHTGGFIVNTFYLAYRPSNKSDLLERIIINHEQCGGRPCIRGMRIRVTDVLDMYASGLTSEQILEEMPDLEPDDLHAGSHMQPAS